MKARGDQSRTRYDGAEPMSSMEHGRHPSPSSQPIELISPELGGMAEFNQSDRGRNTVSKPGNSGDALVFIAMALVSAALGLGLYAHVGVDLPVALIASLGLFVSTSFLHVFVRRMQGVDLLDRRVSALEEKVLHLDDNQSASLEPVPEQSTPVAAAVEGTAPNMAPELATAAPQAPLELPPAYKVPHDATAGFSVDQNAPSIADPVYNLPLPAADRAATSSEPSSFEHESQERPEAANVAANDGSKRSIDGLVRELTQGMSGAGEAMGMAQAEPKRFNHPGPQETVAPSDIATSIETETVAATFGQRNPTATPRGEAGETPLIAMPPKTIMSATEFGAGESPIAPSMNSLPEPVNDPVGQAIQDAVQHGNVEIYLQPILSIDDSKVRFFEVLGRVKGFTGEVIATEDHADLARTIRISSKLDRAILTRAARLLRKLSERRQAQPLFCNISSETLAASSFAHQFVEFMGGYRDIAPFMIFEVDHSAIASADATTLGNLRTLASMGFRLSFDNVTNVEQALANGRELDVSFIKLTYETLFPAQQSQADARARAATVQSVARESGMTLVVDKIERKDQLSAVVGTGANLGQGYLFSEPKPLLPQVAAEVAEDTVAA